MSEALLSWFTSGPDPLAHLYELLGKIDNPDVCEELVRSGYFQEKKDDVINRLVDLAQNWKRLGSLKVCVVFYLLLEYKDYKQCGTRKFLQIMVENIWEQKGTEAHLPAIMLLYEICLKNTFSFEDLALLDDLFLEFLFDLVEQTRDFVDESLNRSLTKLILVISEQMSGFIMKRPNPVLAIVRQRMAGAKTLSENVAVLFNRGSDLLEDAANEELKLILLNFMFLIFQEESTSQFFFVNDLKVVIDTIIRELNDQPAEEEILRQGYCRVLYYILLNSEYRKSKYKKGEISRTLEKTYADESFDQTSRVLAEQIMIQCANLLE